MQLENVMRIINDIEARFPVDKWMVNGIKVWPVIRIHLNYKFQYHQETCFAGTTEAKKSFLHNIIDFGTQLVKDHLALFRDYKHNQKLQNTKGGYVFLSDTNDRRVKVNNAWYDIYCSPIIEELKKNKREYVFLEYCATKDYKFPRFEDTCLIETNLKLLWLRSRLLRSKVEKDSIVLPEYSNLEQYLVGKGLGIFHMSVSTLLQNINTLTLITSYFQKILHQIKPAVAMVVSYYGFAAMAFVMACQKNNVVVIDIQHGVQGPFHAAYGKWSKIPSEGYELLPNIFAVWSEFEKRVIDDWAITSNKHTSYILGNIWNDMWRQAEPSPIVKGFNQQIRSIIGSAHHKAIALFTLQTGIHTPDYLVNVIRNTPYIQWWIRIHPCMLGEEEKIYREWMNFQLKNIIIREATNIPLPALLRQIIVHVTNSSSVVLDAAQFRVPSIIIDRLGLELYHECIQEKLAYYCNTEQALIDRICKIIESGSMKVIPKVECNNARKIADLEMFMLPQNSYHNG